MRRNEAIREINRYVAKGEPFVFVINYDMSDCRVWPVGHVPDGVLYNFQGFSNDYYIKGGSITPSRFRWKVKAEPEKSYSKRFDIVRKHLLRGDSYLVNLTARMEVETSLSLLDIYHASKAKYKLWMKDGLVCFSPETFLQIDNQTISCCPMKGTISSDIPHAVERLMESKKEAAEHATIVDLIRNDLSIVATGVTVENYRYIERLHTHKGDIFQTSSRITGKLPCDFECRLGEIIFSQLPAGSITGAPKPATCRIIEEAENYNRGFYTGIMGCWHNGRLDTAVMIRFMDTDGQRLWFKAGGGITAMSDCHSEYLETLEKIYVPIATD